MFKVGEYVSYGHEGVCIIADIRNETFNALGKSEEYYILTPIKDANSVLYVPLSNKLLTDKMQPLLSAEEICGLAHSLINERLEWLSDSRMRGNTFKEILSKGDRASLVVLVNTLLRQGELLVSQGKKLTAGDETILKRAKKMLIDEFSATTDLENEEDLIALLNGGVVGNRVAE